MGCYVALRRGGAKRNAPVTSRCGGLRPRLSADVCCFGDVIGF